MHIISQKSGRGHNLLHSIGRNFERQREEYILADACLPDTMRDAMDGILYGIGRPVYRR